MQVWIILLINKKEKEKSQKTGLMIMIYRLSINSKNYHY